MCKPFGYLTVPTWVTCLCFAILWPAQLAWAQFSNVRLIQEHMTWMVNDFHLVDVDGDGDLDIIQIGSTKSDIAWLENNGNNEFWERHEIDSFDALIGKMAIADLDGDGDMDIVAIHRTLGRAVWCENLGNGSFAPFVDIMPPGSAFNHLAVGDLTGDGSPEVLLLTLGSNAQALVVKYDGNGGFVNWPGMVQAPESIKRMFLEDMDGDGVLDFLYIGGPNMAVTPPRMARGVGDGTFEQHVELTPVALRDMWPYDLDLDGDMDLIVSYEGQLAYMLNVDGVYQDPVVVDNLPLYTNAFTIAVTDLDGDGAPDLACGFGYGVHWYRWEGTQFGARITLSERPLHGHVKAYDLDQDGQMDLINASSAEGGLVLFRNEGDGEFSELTPLGRGLGQVYDMVMTDLDNDGHQDLVVASRHDSRLAWFPGDPLKFLEPYILIDVDAHGAISVVAVDDNDDGNMDLIVALSNGGQVVRYQNLGGGFFAPKEVVLDQLVNPRHVQAVDLNGDSAEDLIISDSGGRTLYTMLHTGPGTYAPAVVVDNDDLVAYCIAHADVDGDGIADIIAPSFLDNSVYWYAGAPNGTFGPRQTALTGTMHVGTLLAVDVDGDGWVDLLARNQTRRAAWFRNLGDGTFGPGQQIEPGAPILRNMVSADLDQDGDPDLVVMHDDDTMVLYFNDGAGGFEEKVTQATNVTQLTALLVVDADGDGDPDIFFSESFQRGLYYFENYMLGGMRAEGQVYVDLNGNGQRDPGEPPLNVLVGSVPSVSTPVPGANGTYTLYLPEGNFLVSPVNVPPFWELTTTPTQYEVVPDSLTNNFTSGLDFGFQATVDTTVIGMDLVPLPGPCGGMAMHVITLTNQGTTTPAGKVGYTMHDAFTLVWAEPPVDSISGNTLWWYFDEINYGGSHSIQCAVINPTSTLLSLIPDMHLLEVHPMVAGDPLAVLGMEVPHGVTCSYDPNDKQVTPAGYGDHGAVPIATTALTYTLRFQNLGDGPAFNIRLRDQLSEHLDLHSIQLMGWSHVPTDVRVEPDGELAVLYENIMLPAAVQDSLGSQGFLSFRVQVRPGREHLTLIPNEAEIYFDHEPAVVTNTTQTTLVDCGLWEPGITSWGGELQAEAGDAYQWYLNGTIIPGATEQVFWAEVPGQYHAVVTSCHGCVAATDPMAVISTQVETSSLGNLRLFPVPFTDQARLVADEPLTQRHVIVLHDLHGRILGQWQGQGSQEWILHRNGMAAGIYLLRVRDGEEPCGMVRVVVQ